MDPPSLDRAASLQPPAPESFQTLSFIPKAPRPEDQVGLLRERKAGKFTPDAATFKECVPGPVSPLEVSVPDVHSVAWSPSFLQYHLDATPEDEPRLTGETA